MLTVLPVARSRLNVCPAGTVNELILIVVHSTALATSSREEIVPVQEAVRLVSAGVGVNVANTTDGIKVRTRANVCDNICVNVRGRIMDSVLRYDKPFCL